MKWVLVRRREVPVPTIWGFVLLLALAVPSAFIGARLLYRWLAVTEPVGAPVLVIEGWLGPRQLDEAADIFRRGHYRLILTTGGPLHEWPEWATHYTFAHRSAEYLKQLGIIATPVPSPITRYDHTYESAVMVREWAKRTGTPLDALDLVSAGAHARRSRFLWETAFGPQVRIGVFATSPYAYDPSRWWRNSTGARDVFDQATGLVWVKLFFRP